MVRESDNQVILIDFGTSKQYDAESNLAATTTTPVGLSVGYAPVEQYRKGGVSSFSPESDIYALGATFYKLLTGLTPPESIALEDEALKELDSLSPRCQRVITECMHIRKTERPHSIEEVESLLAETATPPKGEQEEVATEPIEPYTYGEDLETIIIEEDSENSHPAMRPKNWKKYFAVAAVAGVIVLGFSIYNKYNHKSNSQPSSPPQQESFYKVEESEGQKKNDFKKKKETTKLVNEKKSVEVVEGDKPSEPVIEDNAQKLSSALRRGDYETVQKLANQGYAPAYVPLAKFYLNNNEYDDANKYAQKAKAAGQGGAQAIISTLDNLGYYD